MGSKEFWNSIFTLTFGTTWTAELSAVLAGRILLPKGIKCGEFLE